MINEIVNGQIVLLVELFHGKIVFSVNLIVQMHEHMGSNKPNGKLLPYFYHMVFFLSEIFSLASLFSNQQTLHLHRRVVPNVGKDLRTSATSHP